ncbi:MAG TPA: DUF2069 domain-containing protein [Ottowia sp.]|uniref:DUF2069 domain-containing protein n=1 Tax=Ottowia sp. TaxID=1898956 RepID=UPI002C9DBA0C|nr:DUF2069 domain-containing protein [Ottowia sp.]HMN21569.1 DUF2069 domain-containing protein [Ottowia sp.]
MPAPDAAPDAAPAPPSPAARTTRAAAVAGVLALVALGLAWELWLAPLRPGGSWWALKVLPLLAALPGLRRYRLHTCRWLALLVWLYFTEGVVRAFSEAGLSALLAALEVLLSLALFAACTAHVRLRLKAGRARTTALETS